MTESSEKSMNPNQEKISEKISISDFLKTLKILRLSEEHKQKCEGKISLQECKLIF